MGTREYVLIINMTKLMLIDLILSLLWESLLLTAVQTIVLVNDVSVLMCCVSDL